MKPGICPKCDVAMPVLCPCTECPMRMGQCEGLLASCSSAGPTGFMYQIQQCREPAAFEYHTLGKSMQRLCNGCIALRVEAMKVK